MNIEYRLYNNLINKERSFIYSKRNIIEDKDLFIQIMQNLSNKIQSVFIRVSSKELDDIIDSDLINMSMDKTPIFICERIKDKIHIVDSSENVFTIELDDFLYADIKHMGKDTEFGFLIEPHRAVAVHLKNDRYIILYYQLIGESVLL